MEHDDKSFSYENSKRSIKSNNITSTLVLRQWRCGPFRKKSNNLKNIHICKNYMCLFQKINSTISNSFGKVSAPTSPTYMDKSANFS